MEPLRRVRRYRVTVERSFVVEIAGEGDERDARVRAAKALIEDLARSPFGITDPLVEAVADEATVRPDELHDTVEL
jgi:hypothetical protein